MCVNGHCSLVRVQGVSEFESRHTFTRTATRSLTHTRCVFVWCTFCVRGALTSRITPSSFSHSSLCLPACWPPRLPLVLDFSGGRRTYSRTYANVCCLFVFTFRVGSVCLSVHQPVSRWVGVVRPPRFDLAFSKGAQRRLFAGPRAVALHVRKLGVVVVFVVAFDVGMIQCECVNGKGSGFGHKKHEVAVLRTTTVVTGVSVS